MIGCLFHRTAWITFIFLLFYRYKTFKVLVPAVLIFFTFLSPLIENVLMVVPMIYTKYVWYFKYLTAANYEYSYFSFKNVEYVVLLLLMLFTDFISSDKSYAGLSRNQSEREYRKLIITMLFFGVIIQFLLVRIMQASYRVAFYTDLAIVFAYDYIIQYKIKNYRFVFVILLAVYVSLRFYSIVSANEELFFKY